MRLGLLDCLFSDREIELGGQSALETGARSTTGVEGAVNVGPCRLIKCHVVLTSTTASPVY